MIHMQQEPSYCFSSFLFFLSYGLFFNICQITLFIFLVYAPQYFRLLFMVELKAMSSMRSPHWILHNSTFFAVHQILIR